MPLWLVEDTEVMNSGYSIVLDRLRSYTNVDILFWRSPGWELDSSLDPIISTIQLI